MRITKNLQKDQELILRFLDVFGRGYVELGASNKYAQPGFFVVASTFVTEFIQGRFFQKEELFLKALEKCGFSPDHGPVGAMRKEQTKSGEVAEFLSGAAKGWQGGDEEARLEVGWAASEYLSILRQHLDRLKTLIFPLLDQNLSPEDEHAIAEGINNLMFANSMGSEADKYNKMIEMLEEELSDWR